MAIFGASVPSYQTSQMMCKLAVISLAPDLKLQECKILTFSSLILLFICEPFSSIYGSSKSCIVNFAFFEWNPFNLPRVVGWYHWNPQNCPKGALFRGYKNQEFFFKNQLKF